MFPTYTALDEFLLAILAYNSLEVPLFHSFNSLRFMRIFFTFVQHFFSLSWLSANSLIDKNIFQCGFASKQNAYCIFLLGNRILSVADILCIIEWVEKFIPVILFKLVDIVCLHLLFS